MSRVGVVARLDLGSLGGPFGGRHGPVGRGFGVVPIPPQEHDPERPGADVTRIHPFCHFVHGVALPAVAVFFGEVSLSGTARPVAHGTQRMKEAGKLGFGQAFATLDEKEVSASGNPTLGLRKKKI